MRTDQSHNSKNPIRDQKGLFFPVFADPSHMFHVFVAHKLEHMKIVSGSQKGCRYGCHQRKNHCYRKKHIVSSLIIMSRRVSVFLLVYIKIRPHDPGKHARIFQKAEMTGSRYHCQTGTRNFFFHQVCIGNRCGGV